MNKKIHARSAHTPAVYREMQKSLDDLLVLYRAARHAMRRQVVAGHQHVAVRLAAHAGFIAKWIAALRAELAGMHRTHALRIN